MGATMAPVAGSGSCPTCIAFVAKPMVLLLFITKRTRAQCHELRPFATCAEFTESVRPPEPRYHQPADVPRSFLPRRFHRSYRSDEGQSIAVLDVFGADDTRI